MVFFRSKKDHKQCFKHAFKLGHNLKITATTYEITHFLFPNDFFDVVKKMIKWGI